MFELFFLVVAFVEKFIGYLKSMYDYAFSGSTETFSPKTVKMADAVLCTPSKRSLIDA